MFKSFHIAVSVANLVIAISTNAYALEFIPLSDFPAGVFYSTAQAISDHGSFVVGGGSRFESAADWSDAFIWENGTGLVSLQTPPLIDSRRTLASSVSGSGNFVAGKIRYFGFPQTGEAFRWSALDGIVGLGYLPGTSALYSTAEDISDDGAVIVGYSNSTNGPTEAFRWTADEGMVGLGDFDGGEFASQAYAVSGDGKTVVGLARSDRGGEAFRWTAEIGMAPLGGDQAGFVGTRARDLSSDGSVIVGDGYSPLSITTLEAFRWTEVLGMQPLGDLPGGYYSSEAYAVSANGSIVVGTSDSAEGGKAFVWDEMHGIRDLQHVLATNYFLESQLFGWKLTVAADVSADGLSIVGTGINPDGNTEAWLVRLDRPLTAPEPSSLALLLVAAASLAGCRSSFKIDRS